MTPKLIPETQRHLWAHVMRLKCEGDLNKLVETPVMKMLDDGKWVSLLERMLLMPTPVKVEKQVVTLSGDEMGIKTDALAYFALALLWKGAIHKRPTVAGQTTSIDLHGYREKIRKYLHGRAGLPPGIFVVVTVCDDKGPRGMIFAPTELTGGRYRAYSILTRGIWFDVFTDEGVGANFKSLCCIQSEKKALHLTNCHRRFTHAAQHVQRTAKVAPSLAR